MNDHDRAPKVVRVSTGKPRVPEPHAADYSKHIPNEVFDLIDEVCPQAELAGGRSLHKFEC